MARSSSISDRVEAMKVLLPDLVGEPDLADRFLREIKVLASLNHPNIAGLRTALRFENQLLMVMEFVKDITLDERLRQGALPVAESVRSISQVLSALAYAHRAGVIHRDINPANMMLTPDGTVKLMDFGIAKGATDRKLTMTGTTMGSLYYMSPEQIRGVQTLDARSDLDSVGVSLYELVTGRRPFDGDSQFAIMSAHLEKTPVPPITLDPRLPAALNDLILLSVQREPEARFQSAEAFGKALESVLGSVAPAVSRAPVVKPAPATTAFIPQANKAHRALWATAGALCFVGILVAAIEFGPWKKAAAESPSTPVPAAAAPAQSPTPVPAPTPAIEPSHAAFPAQTGSTAAPSQAPVQKAVRQAGSPPSPVRTPGNIAAPAASVPAPAAATPQKRGSRAHQDASLAASGSDGATGGVAKGPGGARNVVRARGVRPQHAPEPAAKPGRERSWYARRLDAGRYLDGYILCGVERRSVGGRCACREGPDGKRRESARKTREGAE